MTLALYGKSRRRQGVLVLLALFAVFAALIGGVAVNEERHAEATPQSTILAGQFTFTAADVDTVPAPWVDSDGNGTDAAIRSNMVRLRSGASIRLSVNTIGATDIRLEYAWGHETNGTSDAADDGDLVVEWRVGNSGAFTALATHDIPTSGSTGPTPAADINLPASANNLAEIQIQFRGATPEDDDRARVDDVRVSGISVPTRTIKVQKVAENTNHDAATFNFTTAGFDVTPPAQNSQVAANGTLGAFSTQFSTLPNDGGTITEQAAPSGWGSPAWAVVNNSSGTADCSAVAAWTNGSTATIAAADTGSYVVCFRNTPASRPDLKVISKTATPASTTFPGSPFNWVLTVQNAGNAAASFGNTSQIVLSDQLPSGATYTVTDSKSGMDCAISASRLLTCNSSAGALSVGIGESFTVTVAVTPTAAGTLTNGASNCSVDPGAAITESIEGNNACPTSSVSVADNTCSTSNVQACIALLSPIPPAQTAPANTCEGVNANFVVDISNSVDATELASMKSGIQSFTAVLGASSKFAGTRYAATAANFTTGYVTSGAFSTAVGAITADQGLYTWTEGGIAGARANTANPLASAPPVMFIVTDGSPNSTASGQVPTLTNAMTWVNAANEAIAEANAARGNFWVRVVRAGPADTNLPFDTAADDQLFADAVMTRLAAGAFVPTSFDGLADALLSSAGCNPEVVKSAGIPVQTDGDPQFDAVDWVITITNSSGAAKTGVVVNDANANSLQGTVFNNAGGSCTPATGAGPWTCTIPAKAGTVNGLAQLTVRTTLPNYDICQGINGTNKAVLSGGIVGESNEANYNILPLASSDPACLSDITVHKIEEGSFATASNTWNMRLNNGATNTDQNITDGGTTVFTPLPNGTYSVTEMNAGAVATCSPTVPAGSYTVAWSDTQNGTYTQGAVRSGIVINGTGQHHHVWFKNTPCPPVVSIAKTNSDADGQIPAGSSFTWTISVNVAVNPTTAPITVNDSVPAGFIITNVAETDFGACSFSGQALTNCILPAGATVGAHTITVTATAPADFPRANCTNYTNTATLSGTTGMTVVVAAGETAAAGTATDDVTVINCRDPKLALSKTSVGLPSPLPGGGAFTWQVKAVVTDGPTVAAATIVDTLPAGFVPGTISFSYANGGTPGKLSCGAFAGQVVTCTLAVDAASGDYLINIPVTAPAATTLSLCASHTNQATASFPANQGTVTGSPATNSVTITCPDVSVQKSTVGGAHTITPGPNNITYSIVVSNAGPGTAHNIQVNDTLPAGVTGWAATPPSLCVPGNTPMCFISSIPAGESVTITLTGSTASPASCGPINNTATIVGANDATSGNNTDPGETVTVECPDASVVKSLTTPVSIDSGDTISYSITVAAGPNGASQNVVLTDVLEETMSWTVSGANLAGCNGPVFATGGTLTCTIGTMAANTSRTYTLTAVTTAAVCGIVDNTATVNSTVDVNSNNNSSTAAEVTVKCPNVVLQKTTSTPGPLNAGDPISYTITATNNGTGLAKDFFLVDNLPTTVTGWQIDPANPACAITGTQLRCPGTSPATTTLAGGASLSVTVTGTTTPNSCGSVVNTAHAEASNDGAQGITDAAAPAITVLCPDITVLKDGNGPVNAGDQVVFTITVDNIGQGTAKTVALNDTLLTGQKWTLGGADAAACTLTPQDSPQSLSCSWPTFTGAESAKVITLSHPTGTGSGLACTPVQNTAGVTAANEDSTAASNLNSSTDSVSINCADIKIVKVADASPVSGTDNIGFVIKVWNTGVAPALGVQVTDTLPSNPGLTWSEDSTACGIAAGVLTCNFGTLPGGQTEANATTVHLTSPTTVATCGTVSNPVAEVTTTNDGTATDGENIVVNCPDVTVSKTLYNTPNPVSAGDPIKFRILVTVSGAPGTVAKNVTVNEQLPATTSGWTVESTTPSGICATLVSNLMCTLGNVTIPAGGGPVTFEIIIAGSAIGATGDVTCSGNITNTVTVAAGNESNTTNNQATAPVAVNCPKVELTKTANSESITAGDPLSFTLTVKNTGGGTAHSVVVEDDLPAGLTWSETDGACTIATGKLVCNFAELLPGEANWKSVVVTATTSPAACSSLSNTAFISAGNDNLSGSQQTPSNEVNVDLLCSDVTITKAPQTGDEVLDLGETATFIITVNTATGGDAHDVVVTDTLPLKPGLIWSESEEDCSVTAAAEGVAQVLTCTFDVIADGGSETIEVTSNAMTMSTCGEITNIASVVAGNEDPTKSGDNTSNPATIFVNCPDLEVLKTGANINNGEAPVFTVTVKNKGVGVAKNVSVIEQLPPGTWTTALVAPVPAGCSIDIPGPGCTTLAPNETLTISITGQVTTTQCDPIENTVSVTASNESTDTTIQANNGSTATINITCGTLQIVKIDHVLPGNPNLGPTWDFTVDNGGQAPYANQSIALGGGSVTLQKVPFGTYTVSEVQDQDITTCPVPNAARTFRTLVDDETQDVNAQNLNVTFTFTNEECGIVATTGFLEIHKVSDINGNHVMDAGDTKLGDWPMTITGPEFPGGTVINTDSQGRVLLPGIKVGSYTVVEGSRAGYTTVGVVADDNGPVFSVANTATVDLASDDTDVITFYNQPRGTIVVQKNAVIRHNGIESDSPADRDGWVMTVSSATCGVNQQAPTNAAGIATFSNLPMCTDYVVSENPVNAGSPNFTVVGSPTRSPIAPGLTVATEVTFTNERVTTDPPCPNCSQQPTPTPTQAPPTPSATPSNTVVPTNTVGPSTTTPTAVSTTAGERTPGPAQPTPIAPSTGEGIFGGAVGGTNLLLVLAGLAAVAGGLAVVALGRRSGGR